MEAKNKHCPYTLCPYTKCSGIYQSAFIWGLKLWQFISYRLYVDISLSESIQRCCRRECRWLYSEVKVGIYCFQTYFNKDVYKRQVWEVLYPNKMQYTLTSPVGISEEDVYKRQFLNIFLYLIFVKSTNLKVILNTKLEL